LGFIVAAGTVLGAVAPELLVLGCADAEVVPPPLASTAGPAAGGVELLEDGPAEVGLAEDGLAAAASVALGAAPATGCRALPAGDAAGEGGTGELASAAPEFCAAANGLLAPDPIHGRGCPFHRRYPNPAARTSAISIKTNFHPPPRFFSSSSSSSK